MNSTLLKSQTKVYGWKSFTAGAERLRIRATVRHDDSCGNGHNTFSVTGEIEENHGGRWVSHSSGMVHGDIAKHFPELAPVLKWHLCSTDGPMHYLANTQFLASDRDCHGLRKGEFQQFYGADGLPQWEPCAQPLTTYSALVSSREKPAPIQVQYRPWGRTGAGKARELEGARLTAIWPEVTDAELIEMSDNGTLGAKLQERLPVLLREFKAAVESLGLGY